VRAHLTLPLLAVVACQACQQSNPYESKDSKDPKPKAGPPPKVVGVDPDKFSCTGFLPLADVAAVAMGEVTWEMSPYTPPNGVPRSCNYTLKSDESKVWGVAFDCRDSAQGETLKQIDGWLAKADVPPDGGVANHEVPGIGKRAVDHSRAQLMFLDDDTPCAVAITGPDEISRTALARAVATRLVPENAPMTPRAVKR